MCQYTSEKCDSEYGIEYPYSCLLCFYGTNFREFNRNTIGCFVEKCNSQNNLGCVVKRSTKREYFKYPSVNDL